MSEEKPFNFGDLKKTKPFSFGDLKKTKPFNFGDLKKTKLKPKHPPVERIPQRISLTIEIVLYVIIVVLLVIVAKYSWLMVITRSVRQFSPSVAISMLWVHSALPVGFCLIIFQSLFILFEDIKTLFGE